MDRTKDFLRKTKKNIFGSSSSSSSLREKKEEEDTSKKDASTQTTSPTRYFFNSSNPGSQSNQPYQHQKQPSTLTFRETNPFRAQSSSSFSGSDSHLRARRNYPDPFNPRPLNSYDPYRNMTEWNTNMEEGLRKIADKRIEELKNKK